VANDELLLSILSEFCTRSHATQNALRFQSVCTSRAECR